MANGYNWGAGNSWMNPRITNSPYDTSSYGQWYQNLFGQGSGSPYQQPGTYQTAPQTLPQAPGGISGQGFTSGQTPGASITGGIPGGIGYPTGFGSGSQNPSGFGMPSGGGGMGGMIPTISTGMASGASGMMGAAGGLDSLSRMAQNLMEAMMQGQLAYGSKSGDLNKLSDKLYDKEFSPNIKGVRRQGKEERQDYTSGLWGAGRGFSSMGQQKNLESKQKEDELVANLISQARMAARQQATRDLQTQEASPSLMLNQFSQFSPEMFYSMFPWLRQ